MTGRRFLCVVSNDTNTLFFDAEEHHHLVRVMRARVGMEIEAVNGCGDWFRARITRVAPRVVEAAILKHERRERPAIRLILAPSMLKKRSMDLMLEKLCELGVDEIRPVCFERNDGDCPGEIPERWQRIALQAVKINRRSWATRIFAPVDLESLIRESAAIPVRVMLEISGRPFATDPDLLPILCVIGPPGDFTPREQAELQNAGFVSRRLNAGILRSETAAITAAAVFQQQLDQEP
ncbi:MAG TPA: 16S rRNA (uracil(1498)-N(3))-methyltransferase [Candidatus Aminicenantes bacterium]|nr:16S rRNA (uracil(1498)-N(3))-methyltransferase [Candidatus Aminicenantes bacterium]